MDRHCAKQLPKRLGFTANGFPDNVVDVCSQRVGLTPITDKQGRTIYGCRHHRDEMREAVDRADARMRAMHDEGER